VILTAAVDRSTLNSALPSNRIRLEWSLPEDADISDPRRAIQRRGSRGELLAETREAVPELAFKRFHAGQWTAPEGHWLPAGAWQACEGSPQFTPAEDVWVGVDVGGERSASAVVYVNANLHVGVEIYHGDQGVLDCVDKIRELASLYNVRVVVFDPWRFGQAAQELEREGVIVTTFPQSDVRMIPASNRLYSAIVERRIVLPGHDEMRQHAAAAIARHSRRGWRTDKTSRADNIDSIIALCMALEAAENQPAEAQLLGWL
jgi:phage terminase large subunit-like protein